MSSRARASVARAVKATDGASLALGLLHANAIEWLTHECVLHGLGKHKGSIFRFHWAQHHRIARKNAMFDKSCEAPFWSWKDRGKEILGIMCLFALHLPLIKVAPYFTRAVLLSSFNYLYRHRKAHLDVEWGKKQMPHHYDHHVGPNQDANWCLLSVVRLDRGHARTLRKGAHGIASCAKSGEGSRQRPWSTAPSFWPTAAHVTTASGSWAGGGS